MAVTLDAGQKEAVANLDNGKILAGLVGSGKSITAMGYYMENEAPRDIYVMTTAKKRDSLEWEGEAVKYGIGTRSDATTAGTITVDSWNNIGKYEGVVDGFFIFDEQRLVGSGAWVKAFLKIAAANRWIMLSATPGDSYLDFVPVFIANGFYDNRTRFIERHVVYQPFSKFPKVKKFLDTGHLDELRQSLIVELPYEKRTVRHLSYITTDHDTEAFKRVAKDRWNIYEDRPIIDVAELFRVMRRLVNGDPDRLRKIHDLFHIQGHKKLIIFYNFNYELEALRTLRESLWVPLAEWNGQKHEPIPEGDEWIYLVQYTAGAEGWNCISTDAMIFYSLNYSFKLFEQAQGRIDRRNTPYENLHYYVFKSNSMIDLAILRALGLKKGFNEKTFAKDAGWDLAA